MEQPNPLRKQRDRAIVAAVATFLLAFGLMRTGYVGMGAVFFFLTPVAVGFVFGWVARYERAAFFGTLAGLVFSLCLLAWEGAVCVLMAFPIIWFLQWLGLLIGREVRKTYFPDRPDKPTDLLAFLWVLPLLFAGDRIETWFKEGPEAVTCTSVAELSYAPEQVFDLIKSADTMAAPEGFLQKLGLPRPSRCVLSADSEGAERTCFFSDGSTITARVTRFDRGRSLTMDVTDWKMMGGGWLGFRDAGYSFEKTADGRATRLTRFSTYTSDLRPRFYWKWVERWAVEEQHEFVLRDLRRRLELAGQ